MPLPHVSRAFTLIELLVVITIVAVLLALLTPALDQAIYQGELAVCAARIKGTCGGVIAYTFDHARRYPDRPGLRNVRWKTMAIAGAGYDDRRPIRSYVQINKQLLDPLVDEVDLEAPDSHNNTSPTNVYASYSLFFGWQYDHGGPGGGAPAEQGMFKLGDRFHWEGAPYALLVSDSDETVDYSSHPDRDGRMTNLRLQDGSEVSGTRPGELTLASDQLYTVSRWQSPGGITRGLVDMNYGYTDASVRRVNAIRRGGNPDMELLPVTSFGWPGGLSWQITVPAQ